MLFQQDEALQLFHDEVTEFLKSKFPEKWIDVVGLSLGHLISLTLLSLAVLKVHQVYCVLTTIGCHLPKLSSCMRTVVAHLPSTCLKISTET
jgi:hypothetical protein